MDSSLEIQDLSTVSTENIFIRSKNRRDITKVSKPEISFMSSDLNISEEIDIIKVGLSPSKNIFLYLLH